VKADVFFIETNILRKLNEVQCPYFITAVFNRNYRCCPTGYSTSLVIMEVY